MIILHIEKANSGKPAAAAASLALRQQRQIRFVFPQVKAFEP
jgi:hypothetical protein